MSDYKLRIADALLKRKLAGKVGPVPLKWTVRLLSTRHMTIARL